MCAPARLDAAQADAVSEAALTAHRVMDLRDLSRVDIILDEEANAGNEKGATWESFAAKLPDNDARCSGLCRGARPLSPAPPPSVPASAPGAGSRGASRFRRILHTQRCAPASILVASGTACEHREKLRVPEPTEPADEFSRLLA